MPTKKQREFLKQNLPNKFYIKKDEQVYHYYSNKMEMVIIGLVK